MLHVKKNHSVVVKTKLHQLTVQMARDAVSIHHTVAVPTITMQPEGQTLKDATVNTHRMDVAQTIRQRHEAMIMLDAVVNTRNTVVAPTKLLQLKVNVFCH